MSIKAVITSDARIRLMNIAEQLFARNGYDLTSTRQIAAAAGLNLSLINYYFGSKQALYREIFAARLDEMNVSLQSISWQPLSATDKLGRFLKIYMDRYRINGDFQRMLYRELLFLSRSCIREVIEDYLAENARVFREIMAEGTHTGEFRPLDNSFFHMTVISLMAMILCDVPVAGQQPGQAYNTNDMEHYLYQILLTKNTMTTRMN